MDDKKFNARFTIQFSGTDPAHIQVIDILNRQGRRSKAQYIVNAVLHYENCDNVPQTPRSVSADEHLIEAVVRRILEGRTENRATGAEDFKTQQEYPRLQTETISFDDAINVLGADGLDAIAGALAAFRED